MWIACWRTVRTRKSTSADARVREGAAAQCPPLGRNRTAGGGRGPGPPGRRAPEEHQLSCACARVVAPAR